MEAFEIVEPGVITSIQDLGRYGYQKYGVSVSGAMDKFALRVGNLLVGNDEGEAGIEMTIRGPRFRVLNDLMAAFTGGEFCPRINGNPVRMWQSLLLNRGDMISFSAGVPKSGFRAYMAISGGIDVPLVMGSRSTHALSKLGGLEGRPLARGDVVCMRREVYSLPRSLNADEIPTYPEEVLLRAVPGPQDDYFSPAGLETFFSREYRITAKADRRGYRLDGPKIEHVHGPDILSDGVLPGAVQVPGDGMPIILLHDGGTSGGYSKIATVISPDLDKLAQACPGQKIRFQKVDIAQARRILVEAEDKIREIKSHIVCGR